MNIMTTEVQDDLNAALAIAEKYPERREMLIAIAHAFMKLSEDGKQAISMLIDEMEISRGNDPSAWKQ
ncbi:MAG: hypothetical protein AAF542_22795 [Pseudomonadota bacterium]